ncbi:MAG: CGNR zinc finger domain-containing protein [Blastocatellia bacterium]|nr:CGNR zinc finger domain-containing protein [Blastocatellia bacterium]MBL8196639.1 CGNR zinc finger domain-containing protein [Blastocatellia bacterium]MBN8725751.1 CGNR zinc finger domain-containing protein [Acidobacteriota bacterium]
MNLKDRPVSSLNLIGGRLCLDFVNTVGGRKFSTPENLFSDYIVQGDTLSNYYDLLAWCQLTKILSANEIQILLEESCLEKNKEKIEHIFNLALDLREAIYRICKQLISNQQPNILDLALLNQVLSSSYSNLELIFKEGKFLWQYNKVTLEKMLWIIAGSMADFLTTTNLSRLRECQGNGCCWLFEDSSKNKMRQWCDMQVCGNLAKVRRFRSKLNKKEKAR